MAFRLSFRHRRQLKKWPFGYWTEPTITTLSIADLELWLPDNFVRIDKGIIINSEYIKNFDSQAETVHLLDGQHFPVSRRGQKRLFEAIGAY